MQNSAAQCACR